MFLYIFSGVEQPRLKLKDDGPLTPLCRSQLCPCPLFLNPSDCITGGVPRRAFGQGTNEEPRHRRQYQCRK